MNVIEDFELRGLKNSLSQGILVLIIGVTLISYVYSLNAFISPSRELRWDSEIDYINGISFNPGAPVTISGTLIEGDSYFSFGNYYSFFPEDIRWILVVKDPNNMPIHLETNAISGANGQIETNDIGFTLPSTSISGTYRVKLLVWTGLLPDGEIRTRQVQEFTFEVV